MIITYNGVDFCILVNSAYVAVDKVCNGELEEKQVFFAQGDDMLVFDGMTELQILEYLDSAGVL